MMTKKQAAAVVAALLTTVAGVLYKCQDETPVGSRTPATTVVVDAGVSAVLE